MFLPLDHPSRRPRILVVDDRPEQFEVMSRLLRPIADTEYARTGMEAFLKTAEARFDAILVDVKLEEISGLRVAEALRRGSHHDRCPIIAYSSSWELDTQVVVAAGCNDFLRVPFADGELERTVKYWLNYKLVPG